MNDIVVDIDFFHKGITGFQTLININPTWELITCGQTRQIGGGIKNFTVFRRNLDSEEFQDPANP